MLELNLPQFEVKIKKTDKIYIWDIIRNKYLVLTPEEWVRQHFVNYMIHEKGFPKTLIANEIQIKLNNQKRRCDTVIYNSNLTPEVIVEYKSPEVKITQDVFDQIVRYNIVLKVRYLIVSNGMEHYCCKIDYNTMKFEYLTEIPSYDMLNNW